MLSRAAQFNQVDREERAVYQAVNEMIDQFTQQKSCAFRVRKQGLDGSKHVLRARRPDIKLMSDLG